MILTLRYRIRIDDSVTSKVLRRAFMVSIIFVSTMGFTSNFETVIGLESERDELTRASAISTFDELQRMAADFSTRPFETSPVLPEAWSNLSYDEYRKVAFDPTKAIWRSEGSPFYLEGFHRGFVHSDHVSLYSIVNGGVERIPFRSSMFDYRGSLDGTSLTSDFGFAGFRVVGKFPLGHDWQEMLTFLGASYFRARTAKGGYGSSARGLAIDVGLNKSEEFPVFRSFWIEKPRHDAVTVRCLALMDSPAVVGAYQFRFKPGIGKSIMDVDATLYFRHTAERVGIAPLTSMWMWGDGLEGPADDSRPEVHDSDALLIHNRSDDASRATSKISVFAGDRNMNI